ncbi:MAG: hypothetical protein FWD47_01705 [Treponema sp.]|nr:hypothetical protein [Treponema sp.]
MINKKKQCNAERALQTAKSLYPHEKWDIIDAGIFIAKSRMPRSAEQIKTLDKELKQAFILVDCGSTVYLLPENPNPGEKHKKYPDAVVDGHVMEFKTITGSIRQVEVRYKEARAKALYIFLKIDSQISRHEFTRKLSGFINRKGFNGGVIFAYFTQIGEFHHWTEEELSNSVYRQKKSGSSDPAAIQGKTDIPKCPR